MSDWEARASASGVSVWVDGYRVDFSSDGMPAVHADELAPPPGESVEFAKLESKGEILIHAGGSRYAVAVSAHGFHVRPLPFRGVEDSAEVAFVPRPLSDPEVWRTMHCVYSSRSKPVRLLPAAPLNRPFEGR